MSTTDLPPLRVEVTAGPYRDRDGRWTVVARVTRAVLHHVCTRARWDHYDLSGGLTAEAVEDLTEALADEFNITIEDAAEALLRHTRKAP